MHTFIGESPNETKTRMEGRAQREATRNRRVRRGDGREGERRGVEARGEGEGRGREVTWR